MDVSSVSMGALDYTVFGLMLLVSAGIGVYFRFAGGKQKTTEEFLLAGKDMSVLPVAFSLMASFLSAITFIGTPAEMYRFGISMAYMRIGYIIGMVVSAFLFLPVFFRLQASSAYEYLERRFGRITRSLISAAFTVQMILYMGVVLYAPSLALSAVMALPTWMSVMLTGAVCTFYCTLGGMKAVLWTDVFQAILMFLGLFIVLAKGTIDVGGFSIVIDRAMSGGRILVPSMDFDFTTRYTLWGVIISGTVVTMCSYSGNQVQIQRLLTVKNFERSRAALLLSIPMTTFFNILCCIAGLVVYANFYDCDPIASPWKSIKSTDQLLPYYMMVSLGSYPGLLGLCICGVFSATLSTISSAVNSLSAVTMEDFVRPVLKSRGLTQAKAAFLAKAITLGYGALFVMIAFLVSIFENLTVASHTVYGMLGGPILGIFLLGMLTTKANEKGVVIGFVSAVALSAWISFGSSAHASAPITLPISTDGCLSRIDGKVNETFFGLVADKTISSSTAATLISNATQLTVDGENLGEDDVNILYRISYIWITPLGFVVSFTVGYIASFITACITGEEADVPVEYLSPAVRWFLRKSDKYDEQAQHEYPLTHLNGTPQLQH